MQFKAKLIIDVAITIGMFFSMSFQLLGIGVHKMIGLITFLLFVVHNILNRKWHGRLFKGAYSSARWVHTFINFLVVFAMIGVMVSGVILSKEMAQGFDGMTTGRILHNLSSYIGCIGIALHIGFHLKGRKYHDD